MQDTRWTHYPIFGNRNDIHPFLLFGGLLTTLNIMYVGHSSFPSLVPIKKNRTIPYYDTFDVFRFLPCSLYLHRGLLSETWTVNWVRDDQSIQ